MSNKVILVVHPYLGSGPVGRPLFSSSGMMDIDLPLDYMEHFRGITKGCDLLMDRSTWFSLPIRPLPMRGTHYVVTQLDPVQAATVRSVEEGILRYRSSGNSEPLCVIGGEWVFKKALPFADELSVTRWRDRRQGESMVEFDPSQFMSLEDRPRKETLTTHYFRK